MYKAISADIGSGIFVLLTAYPLGTSVALNRDSEYLQNCMYVWLFHLFSICLTLVHIFEIGSEQIERRKV